MKLFRLLQRPLLTLTNCFSLVSKPDRIQTSQAVLGMKWPSRSLDFGSQLYGL